MKIKIFYLAVAIFFLCGKAFSQIYTPVNPTVYGQHDLRNKVDSVQGIPTKDSVKSTTDTLSQIFIRYSDTTLWTWTKRGGFIKYAKANSIPSSFPYWRLSDGGPLTGNNTIYGSGHSLFFNAPNTFVVHAINSTQLNGFDGVDTNNGSEIDITKDSIDFHPRLGNLNIDSLNNLSYQNTLIGWTSTSGSNRGRVGYTTIGTGISLSGGVLSNTVTATSPAGNYGNLQINRNGVFATPASDSLTFSTGLSVKGTGSFTESATVGAVTSGNKVFTIQEGAGQTATSFKVYRGDGTAFLLGSSANSKLSIYDGTNSNISEVGFYGLAIRSAAGIRFGDNNTGTYNAGINRIRDGWIGIGNGTLADTTGSLTFNKAIISGSSIASTPTISATGTWYSGGSSTTTKPYVLIEPTGTTSTAWNTLGTGIGINAASGFAGSFIEAQIAGALKFVVYNAGASHTGYFSCGYFKNNNNNFRIYGANTGTGAIGAMTLYDGSESGAAFLQLGGTSSSYPGFNRNGTAVEAKLADNSAYTNIGASGLYGGSSTTSTLTLKPTTGVGTTGADILFKVGNNGATQAGRILNAGTWEVGSNGAYGIMNFLRNDGTNMGSIQGGSSAMNIIGGNGITLGVSANGIKMSGTATWMGSGNISNGTPTALVHIATNASTSASTAPLKYELASANIMATPERGAEEVKGNRRYYTDSTATRRVIFAGGAPTIATGAASGSSASASFSTNSTDMAGELVITTAGNDEVVGGVIATITFSSPYSTAPFVNLTPSNKYAADIPRLYSPWYIESSTTGFIIRQTDTFDPLQDGLDYKFHYSVTQ